MFLTTDELRRPRVDGGCRATAQIAFAVLLGGFTLASCNAGGTDLTIADARVRALIPGQDKTVGYFEITNSGTTDVVLVSARSGDARTVELHTVARDGQMLRMRRLKQLAVPAGTTVEFSPGGNHLMLFGVPHLEEDTVIELTTADGRTISAAFRQIPAGADG